MKDISPIKNRLSPNNPINFYKVKCPGTGKYAEIPTSKLFLFNLKTTFPPAFHDLYSWQILRQELAPVGGQVI